MKCVNSGRIATAFCTLNPADRKVLCFDCGRVLQTKPNKPGIIPMHTTDRAGRDYMRQA